jgi:DNA-binding transcriptional MerR regulator/methylmalonyl-CoA mutase cobalamin-binding subunit
MKGERLIAIGVVEREVGIPKETLRIWERRYGVPRPTRSAGGERLYGEAEIATLRLVKQLLDRGFRPGTLLGQSEARLRALVASLAEPEAADTPQPQAIETALDLVKSRRIAEFQQWLQRRLHEAGLKGFVLDVARPLCQAVGHAWERGEFAVFEEHMVTEQLQILLRGAIQPLSRATGRPRVLLTTLPGEEHVLGLLMLQAVLSVQGASCLSLGLQTPAADIAACCKAETFDIVALSFSACFPSRRVGASLNELRAALDPAVALWAGGSGITGLTGRRHLKGVALMKELEDGVRAITARR